MRTYDPMRGGGLAGSVLRAMRERLADQLRPAPEEVEPDAGFLTEYAGRPLDFAREVLGLQVWPKMAEVIYSVLGYPEEQVPEVPEGEEAEDRLRFYREGHDETYVRAGQKVSKTLTAAVILEYWHSVLGRPAVTTAPTGKQVKNLLWRQIRVNRMVAKRRGYRLPGRLLEVEIKNDNRPDVYAYGFTAENAEGAQGLHSPLGLLIIVDEAAGVEDWLWTAIKGSLEEGCRLLAIGNPNTRRNQFRSAFFERLGSLGVASLHISSYDSPNVVARKTVIKGLATLGWCKSRLKDWGEQSIEYITKVLGNFPCDSNEKVIPMEWIWEAFRLGDELAAEEASLSQEERERLFRVVKASLDVARAGSDNSALSYLGGQRIKIAFYVHEPDTMKTASMSSAWVCGQPQKPEHFIVDVGAVGGGVYDRLVQLADENPGGWGECEVADLDWGWTPDEPTRYVELVDELYGRLRNALDPSKPRSERLGLPTEEELRAVGLTREKLAAQLNARKMDYDERNRMKVERKRDLRNRHKELGVAGKSPDVADAIVGLMLRPRSKEVKVLVF